MLDEDFLRDLKQMVEDVKAIKSTVSKTDEKLDTINSQIAELKFENEGLKSTVKDLISENRVLHSKVNELEQYSRKDNIIINGLPYSNDENIGEMVMLVSNALKVPLFDYDISAVHRLPSRDDKIPAVIVRLNSRSKKSQLVENSKKMRLHGKSLNLNPAVPIYVSEHLTPNSMHILKNALQLKTRGMISQAWSRDGKIFIRQKDNEATKRITDLSQLPTQVTEQEEDNQTGTSSSQFAKDTNQMDLRSKNKPLTLSQLNTYPKKNKSGKTHNKR